MILAIVVVAVIVLLTAYFVLKLSNEKELKKIVLEKKKNDVAVITPLRLQAYERIALFLERIRPESILLRELPINQTASQYHIRLLTSIRDEFEHNLSQQVYISTALWEASKQAREETVKIINLAASQLKPEDPGASLASRILELTVSVKVKPSDAALQILHNEVKELY